MRLSKIIALSWVVPFVLLSVGCTMPPPVKVMTFNIRYGTAPDGENRWELRRDLLIETIHAHDPDILGMQEVLLSQAEEIRAALPEYEFVGVGRDDGELGGEFSPIMFRRKLFTLKNFGYVWLSPEPDKPGVKGWDAACPRMVTWVNLQFKKEPLFDVNVINTHFDHVGEKARLESARIIRRMTDSMGGKPVIVMGDFNATPDSPPYEVLTGEKGNLAELHDAHRAKVKWNTDLGTFHGFTGEQRGKRIDWILMSRRFMTMDYEIDQREEGGRYPSDHYPVIALLRMLPT